MPDRKYSTASDFHEAVLTTKQAAREVNLAPSTLAKMRVRGEGPPFVKLTKRAVRYIRRDLLQWRDRQSRISTSDRGLEASTEDRRLVPEGLEHGAGSLTRRGWR